MIEEKHGAYRLRQHCNTTKGMSTLQTYSVLSASLFGGEVHCTQLLTNHAGRWLARTRSARKKAGAGGAAYSEQQPSLSLPARQVAVLEVELVEPLWLKI